MSLARPNGFVSVLIFLFSISVMGFVAYEFISALNSGYVRGRLGAVYAQGEGKYYAHMVLYGVGILLGAGLCRMSLKWLRNPQQR